MKLNYRRLGDYIREVNVRNRDLAVTELVGLSIDKIFIPSVANTIGTDMSNYKIIRNGQFACSLMQVSRDEKIPIAMLREEEAIMSPAYPMFEVINTEVLLPEYVMMWFSRSEFDREASFYAVGGVRGSLTWEDFCNLTLPIPAIEIQREIVAEYKALSRRIAINEQICDKLEQTASALYRKMFIDNIDPSNLPLGWRMGKLGGFVNLSQGIQVEVEDQYFDRLNGYNRFVRIIDYTPKTTEPPRYVSINDQRYFCSKYEVAMIRYGDAGTVCRRIEGIIANNLFKISPTMELTHNYVYYFLKSEIVSNMIKGTAASSTMPAITHGTIKELDCIIPEKSILANFDKLADAVEGYICLQITELMSLKELKKLLLSKLVTN